MNDNMRVAYMYVRLNVSVQPLRPPRGVVSTKLTNLVSLEQYHHKPTGMYDGCLLPIGL